MTYAANLTITEHPASPFGGRDPEDLARRRRLADQREALPPWRDGPTALASRALDCLQYELPLPALYRLPDGREISTRDYLAQPNAQPVHPSVYLPWMGSPARQANDPVPTWGELNAEILRRCTERGVL